MNRERAEDDQDPEPGEEQVADLVKRGEGPDHLAAPVGTDGTIGVFGPARIS